MSGVLTQARFCGDQYISRSIHFGAILLFEKITFSKEAAVQEGGGTMDSK